MTHADRILANGGTPQHPPVTAGAYLLRHLSDAGTVAQGGMGPVPLGHADLQAYQHNLGIVLQPWEVQTLRRLSADYCAEAQRAQEPDAVAPFAGDIEDTFDRSRLAERIKSALGGS